MTKIQAEMDAYKVRLANEAAIKRRITEAHKKEADKTDGETR